MNSRHGSMSTDRPERYAKQLASHWSAKGTQSTVDGATVLKFDTGQVIVLRPELGVLEIEVTVPADDDIDRFAQVVKRHLERFGTRDELEVVWSAEVR